MSADTRSATWFVTGASRGFGRELTEQLLARGHTVAATLRRPEQLDDLAGRHQDRLWVRALDVTDTAQMRRVVAEAPSCARAVRLRVQPWSHGNSVVSVRKRGLGSAWIAGAGQPGPAGDGPA